MVKGSGKGYWLKRKRGRLLFCYRNDAGKTRTRSIGSADMNETEAGRVIERLKLIRLVRMPDAVNAHFRDVVAAWLKYGKTKTGEPKDANTLETDERNARLHLSHWNNCIPQNMQPAEIQGWLDGKSRGLRSKLRNMMSAVFMHGLKFGMIPRGESGEMDRYNPIKLVSAPVGTDFEAVQVSGAEAAAIIRTISDPLVRVLVILVTITGMRISEALALTWGCVNWKKGKIRIVRKWNGKGYGNPKSKMSRRPVEMTSGLAAVLQAWRRETQYAKEHDLLFPSYRKNGEQPRLASMLVEDYLRPAAIKAGVLEMEDGECYYDDEAVARFGFHSLRHGLATWLAENGTSPDVIQRMLRHSSKEMTMHYIHADARKAQERYIAQLGLACEHCGSTSRV